MLVTRHLSLATVSGVLLLALCVQAPPAAAQAKPPAAGKKASAATKPSASKSKKSSRRRGRVVARGPAAPSPERIREIQQALARAGHYRGQPTGKLDAGTSAAISSFQSASGLDVTGRLGVMTLKRLEAHGLRPYSSLTATEQGNGKTE